MRSWTQTKQMAMAMSAVVAACAPPQAAIEDADGGSADATDRPSRTPDRDEDAAQDDPAAAEVPAEEAPEAPAPTPEPPPLSTGELDDAAPPFTEGFYALEDGDLHVYLTNGITCADATKLWASLMDAQGSGAEIQAAWEKGFKTDTWVMALMYEGGAGSTQANFVLDPEEHAGAWIVRFTDGMEMKEGEIVSDVELYLATEVTRASHSRDDLETDATVGFEATFGDYADGLETAGTLTVDATLPFCAHALPLPL